MAYVYRHIRLDKNEVFYVGIGSDSTYHRANSLNKRSRYWKFVTDITKFEVEIIYENDSVELVKEKEKEFIKLYGRKDLNEGTLVNMTDGGDGGWGYKHSEEFKKRVSEMNKKRVGDKNPNYGRKWDDDYKEKIRQANTGKKRTEETKLKISRSKINPDRKKKERKGLCRGERHHAFGKKNEWLSEWSKNQKGSYNPRSKKVIDESNGLIYSCVREASEKTGINYSTLRGNLNPNKTNRTTFRYIDDQV